MINETGRDIETIFITHKGKNIPTSVGSFSYESLYSESKEEGTYRNGNIPAGYSHRPDLIANLFTGTPSQWWVICEDNAIFDVFEQLNSGDVIRVPR
jgi:hypothetical protein